MTLPLLDAEYCVPVNSPISYELSFQKLRLSLNFCRFLRNLRASVNFGRFIYYLSSFVLLTTGLNFPRD